MGEEGAFRAWNANFFAKSRALGRGMPRRAFVAAIARRRDIVPATQGRDARRRSNKFLQRTMKNRLDVASEFWTGLLRHSPLGILTDVDGTLVPFKARPDDVDTTPELRALIADVAACHGVTLAVVSGRPREELERLFPEPRNALLVAEHGAWRTGPNGWEATLSVDPSIIDSLVVELDALGAQYENARIERKTWSAAIHFRRLSSEEKADLLVRVSSILDPWLRRHPQFERLWGNEVLEVRPRGATKATAVTWIREQLGVGGRLVIIGDDVTDEDMFVAASEHDAAILVGAGAKRPTSARWRLPTVEQVRSLLDELVVVRRDAAAFPSVRPNALLDDEDRPRCSNAKLLVVSNRLPDIEPETEGQRARNVGGLVSALRPVLEDQDGVWLGWSGRTTTDASPSQLTLASSGKLTLASIDFPDDWHTHYYNGFSNSALWPLFHSFPGRLRFSHDDWRSYVLVNDAFATAALQLASEDATIWVHDYHLLLVAHYLRARGHQGQIGQFLHIPFPGPDLFFLLPWANDLLDALLDFDLIGFHTRTYADNFLHCAAHRPGVQIENSCIIRGGRRTLVGVFPLGVTPEDLSRSDVPPESELLGVARSLGENRLVLGVDRLDYTKGIPERIEAFGRLLELFPEWRRRVCLVQVSVPSRTDIGEYAEQRSRIENSVGRINGAFGEADWVPIRYLYRSYAKEELAELYRDADVGYVTPLRDGMNLVAKEFVAAQDPANPGVLVLSRFAGAAEELTDAVLTNPWDAEGTVHDLDLALRMPLEERQRRHASLYDVVSRTTSVTWADEFLGALMGGLEDHQTVDAPRDSTDPDGGRSSGLWAYPASGIIVGRGAEIDAKES